MELSLFLFLLASAILAASPVSADFYIYRMWQIFTNLDHGVTTYSDKYAFFPGPPDCIDVEDRWHAQDSKRDLSGKNRGVRCEGLCGPRSPFDPKIIEFNNAMGHYTYYRDLAGELRDTNDNVIGHCHTDVSDSVNGCYSLRDDINDMGVWHGNSLVYCETALTACKVFYDPHVDRQC